MDNFLLNPETSLGYPLPYLLPGPHACLLQASALDSDLKNKSHPYSYSSALAVFLVDSIDDNTDLPSFFHK